MKKKVLIGFFSLVVSFLVILTVFFEINKFNIIPYENITIEEFNKKIEMDKSMYVYIYKPSCVACNTFKPIITEALEEVDITLYALDVGDNSDISFLEDHEIQEVPVIRKYTNGKIEKNNIGVLSKNDLIHFFE